MAAAVEVGGNDDFNDDVIIIGNVDVLEASEETKFEYQKRRSKRKKSGQMNSSSPDKYSNDHTRS